ncbi:MAG TPA: PPOX class F420-dependent oxidoreductase [Ktedonobacterales bacterium]|nr:PPOX class F420-dependent oxidoreductase [Ktedonobacterales bacterium]
MRAMTPDECRRFLWKGNHTMVVATLRADGRPHLTPVWYTLDGERVAFQTPGSSAKVRHIRRDPRITVFVDDEAPPFAYVTVEGAAEVVEAPAELRHWVERIGARYLGEEQAETYREHYLSAGDVLVWVTPTKISGFDFTSDDELLTVSDVNRSQP